MSKAWRIVGTVVLVLAIAGIVSAGIGMLTGASFERMIENIFGGPEALEMMLDVLKQEIGNVIPDQIGVSIVTG